MLSTVGGGSCSRTSVLITSATSKNDLAALARFLELGSPRSPTTVRGSRAGTIVAFLSSHPLALGAAYAVFGFLFRAASSIPMPTRL